jgi:transcription-repair coupling factor (superfamily II helicase)
MKAINQPLLESEEFLKIKKEVRANRFPVLVTGCIDVQKSHFIQNLGEDFQFRIIITHSEIRAKELYESYRFFDKNVFLYPAKDVLFYSADIHGHAIMQQRIRAMKKLYEPEKATIIMTIDGAMDRLSPLEEWEEHFIHIDGASIIDTEQLKQQLITLGYEKNYQVESPGQFSIRGDIIDIFPLTEDNPYRVELWGEEIDSIRSFDVESQRSIEQIEEITVYPATEMVLTEERIRQGIQRMDQEHKGYAESLKKNMQTEAYARINKEIARVKEELTEFHASSGLDSYIEYFFGETVSFLDYFADENAIIFVDEPARVNERAEGYQVEFRESMKGRLEGGYILPTQANVLFDWKQVMSNLLKQKVVLLSTLAVGTNRFAVKTTHSLSVRSVPSYHNDFPELLKDLKNWKRQKYQVIILTPTGVRAKKLVEDIRYNEESAIYRENLEEPVAPGTVVVAAGKLPKGFEYPELRQVIIAENDIFSKREKKAIRTKQYAGKGDRINSFSDISVGDYVVHESHGVGIYKGIEKIDMDGITKDYISIEYLGGSKLFIPATGLDLIQKYASAEAKTPKLNKLGGEQWVKTKTKVRGQVKEIAKELVELYATRQMTEGYCYGPDTTWQQEFEEMFPYEETYDQLRAIEETKKDMESTKIMDRLLCGDVGYGKTEVAIRAAFKAVTEGKQVVYLVPTTILAQQHYNTFVERMKDYPITVEMLSRFRNASQQKKTIEGLKKGSVDIVIGTHRVLSKDIAYKDLGLLIIDEEQRFGVAHKEKIKTLKKDVDVLSLSATPIPRTLHMSLIGIRDMSLLEEPPMDRRAIQTYVLEFNEELVREAILREVSRGGQVYYVYNRVNTIQEMAALLQELVPDVNVAFAHGQMSERELEKIMLQFINKEIDVLVSTTIIETGLDISNVNTMIIHDADKLGLSQLYQLRGRVGRSSRTAYAFFMYRRDNLITETAEKRLQAIREFTDLGSGYKIAMRDLEIRGAGSLLGAKQSGHMEAVGYDLYCKMLNEAVAHLKGIGKEDTFETTIDLSIDAFIPATYVRNEKQKLELYKRIASITTQDDMEEMQDELMDRFGEIPGAVNQLLKVAVLKAKANETYITEISQKGKEITFSMYPEAKLQVEQLDEVLKEWNGKLKIVPGVKPIFRLSVKDVLPKDLLNCVNSVINSLNRLIEKEK